MKRRNSNLYAFVMVSVLSASLLTGCGQDASQGSETQNGEQVLQNGDEGSKIVVEITGADNISVEELSTFDPLEGVKAKDEDGNDVTSSIEVIGAVNTLKAGEYEITYTVKSSSTEVKRVVTVTPVEGALANGTYDFKFADAELRNSLMAQAEDYLLHNQFAGIPLYANAKYCVFSNRVQLPVKEYNIAMEYGAEEATMSADDSKVTMEDGKPGKAGEYTYRTSMSTNPSTWNQWQSQDVETSLLMEQYYGFPYKFQFNEDKTSYVLEPSMASEDPIAVDAVTLESGKEVAKKWQIKIRDGLEWKFNSNTDISMITDTKINAVDFYDTFKLALEKKWFRATNGGFCSDGESIVNIQKFIDGEASWEDVGIKLIDDNTIQLEFDENQTAWKVKYILGSPVYSPINMELYNAIGDKYGTDEETIGYHGIYYVDYYESDKIVRLKKNEKYHDAEKYSYTGKNVTIIPDTEMQFQEFSAGKLDDLALPPTHYEEYKSHPGLKPIPGGSVFRMMINGAGNVEKQRQLFPDGQWIPEPILGNKDFKKAMFHAIDRKKLATEVMKTSQPMMYLFSDVYVVDAESAETYRKSEEGKAVGADLSPSTYGYNLEAAKAYYEKALDTLVAEGVYKSGDEINIEFNIVGGDETYALIGAYVKGALEEAFNSEKHNIKVTVDAIPKDFPAIYNDYMNIAEFDLSIGGISGSALDAAGFLDTYCSDNRSGFTLNWGIDTSVPELDVVYKNFEGEYVKETWSYDALVVALNGQAKVVDGKEVK